MDRKKLDHSEFDTFKDFYTNGWQKFVEYNIIDVELVDRMEDKMKLIELAITMAYDAKANYTDVFLSGSYVGCDYLQLSQKTRYCDSSQRTFR